MRAIAALSAAGFLALLSAPRLAHGLDITLDSGSGSLQIVDNDANDTNAETGIIDFDVSAAPVGGIFAATGRVMEVTAPIRRIIALTSTPPAPEGILQNTGVAAATFTVTINSSPYATAGPPLGWTVNYSALADDPTPDDVEITAHGVALYADGTELLDTLTADPISPPVAPASQPVAIENAHAAADAAGDSSATRLTFTFTAGPGDRIRLPDDSELDGVGIEASVFDNNQKCIDWMDSASREVVKKAVAYDAKCLRLAAHAGGGDVTACVDATGDKSTDRAEAKVISYMQQRCQPPPAWGVNGGLCCENSSNDGASCATDGECPGGACLPGACLSAAAETSLNQLTHDTFGATVTAAAGRSCQATVLGAIEKVIDRRLDEYRRCVRDAYPTITDDASLVATCLGPPQPDPRLRIARQMNSLEAAVAHCATPFASSFPGVCGSADDASIGACLGARAACRFCLMVNQTNDLDPPLDCDLFDDGSTNASCP